MYFLSFTVNVLAWVAVGVLIAHQAWLLIKEQENSIFLAAGVGALIGGVVSSMIHGMYPEIGIDLYNILASGSAAMLSLYIFVPKTRTVFFVRLVREFRVTYKFLTNTALWRRNIASLIPR